MANEAKRLMTVNVGDERRLLTMRTILSYESEVRGLTLGQTMLAMLMEAADVEHYPAEVRERLDELRAEQRERAAARSLSRARAS